MPDEMLSFLESNDISTLVEPIAYDTSNIPELENSEILKIAEDVLDSVKYAYASVAANRGPDTFLFPARLHGVSAVSAADLDGKPLEWCCQNRRVDCYAPGQVWSTRFKNIDTTNGSSLATVLAAGVTTLRLAREQRL